MLMMMTLLDAGDEDDDVGGKYDDGAGEGGGHRGGGLGSDYRTDYGNIHSHSHYIQSTPIHTFTQFSHFTQQGQGWLLVLKNVLDWAFTIELE